MNRTKHLTLGLLLALQAADGLSTRAALSRHGVVELNPLVNVLGLWPAKLLVCGLIVALVWRARRVWHLLAVCVVYVAIVLSNLHLAEVLQ